MGFWEQYEQAKAAPVVERAKVAPCALERPAACLLCDHVGTDVLFGLCEACDGTGTHGT